MAATPQERLALGVAALLLAAGAAARALSPGPPAAELTGGAGAEPSVSRMVAEVAQSVEEKERRARPRPPGEKIELNTASVEELSSIVGPARARAIVDYRTSIGFFPTLEEVDAVPRVGPATVEKLRAAVTVTPPAGVVPARPSFQSAASVADWDRSPPRTKRAGPAPPGGVVDLNRASARELASLPGIGEALAGRIVAWRESHGPFPAVDSLTAVPGIGKARVERLRSLVRATP